MTSATYEWFCNLSKDERKALLSELHILRQQGLLRGRLAELLQKLELDHASL